MRNQLIFLRNKITGYKQQYAGFSYYHINGIDGYLGIDGDNVIFIYADQRGVVMEVLDNYEIIESLEPTEKERAIWWAAYGERGLSSMSIYNFFAPQLGLPKVSFWSACVPADGADFGRCYGLLLLLPEWKARLDELTVLGSRWESLIKNWDKLSRLHELEKAGHKTNINQYMERLYENY